MHCRKSICATCEISELLFELRTLASRINGTYASCWVTNNKFANLRPLGNEADTVAWRLDSAPRRLRYSGNTMRDLGSHLLKAQSIVMFFTILRIGNAGTSTYIKLIFSKLNMFYCRNTSFVRSSGKSRLPMRNFSGSRKRSQHQPTASWRMRGKVSKFEKGD